MSQEKTEKPTPKKLKDAREKGVYMGFPAVPAGEWRRQVAHTRRLPKLEERLKELEARLGLV